MIMVAILHNIRSLHNVGSIFRTADAAGVKKLYLTGITPAPVDRFGKHRLQFSKVSLGAERTVAWEKKRSATRVMQNLRADGYKIFAVEQAKKSVPYYKTPKRSILNYKLCLIVGNEVRGLTRSVLDRADEVIEIPMKGVKESLNVSVAFGVAVYYFTYEHRVR